MGGGAPNVPAPPQPTAEEKQLQQKQIQSIDVYLKTLEEQKAENKATGLLSQVASGLYDPIYTTSGRLIDAKLNPERVSLLQQDFETQRRIGLLQADRTERALKGELPVSEGLVQRKAKDFGLLRESAARRGINIEGDSPETATSSSTSGNELVGQFQRTYGLLEDAERRGELAGSPYFSAGGGTLGTAQGASAYGPGALAGGYSQAAGLLGQAQQPYQYQRGLVGQADYQSALNKAGAQANRGQLVAGGAATGATIGSVVPGVGTAIGAGVGAGAGLLASYL